MPPTEPLSSYRVRKVSIYRPPLNTRVDAVMREKVAQAVPYME